MIEFNGQISGKCKDFMINRQIRNQTIALSISCLLFAPIVILMSILVDKLFLMFFVPLFLLIALSFIKPGEKVQKTFLPIRVYVDFEEKIVVRVTENGKIVRLLSSVKRIEDYGDWYYFVFNYEGRDPYFVCQKNLLSVGTISDFEKAFADKITSKV